MNTPSMRSRLSIWRAGGVVLVLLALLLVVVAWRVEADPGDDDATFVPISPCRLFDTRNTADVPFGPDVWRSFLAHGTNGNCVIPTTAVGLSMNVTAVDPTMPTFLTVYPDDEPLPLASSLNPVPGEPPTPNAVSTALSPGGRFRIYNLQGVVHVIVDINGYYVQTSLRELHQRVAALEAADPAGLSDPERVEGSIQSVPPGGAFNDFVQLCPQGKIAINGGIVNTDSSGFTNDFDPLVVGTSEPDSTLIAWNVTVFNDTSDTQYYRKWVLCAAE